MQYVNSIGFLTLPFLKHWNALKKDVFTNSPFSEILVTSFYFSLGVTFILGICSICAVVFFKLDLEMVMFWERPTQPSWNYTDTFVEKHWTSLKRSMNYCPNYMSNNFSDSKPVMSSLIVGTGSEANFSLVNLASLEISSRKWPSCVHLGSNSVLHFGAVIYGMLRNPCPWAIEMARVLRDICPRSPQLAWT